LQAFIPRKRQYISVSVYYEYSRVKSVAVITLRVDARLVDEAAKILGAKSRTDAVHKALREIVTLRRFKKLMKKHAGKLEFAPRDR
jgi:Arc/MetJ family transcription regulator